MDAVKLPETMRVEMARVTDEQIEEVADKMVAGQPLSRAERRLLDSPQADFAMGQVRAYLNGAKKPNDND